MSALIKLIDSISDFLGKIISYLVYVLLIVVVFEVISRKVFGSPTVWGFEFSFMLYAVMFMLGFGFTLKHKMHIGIDIFYSNMSPRKQGFLDLFTYIVFFFPFIYFAVVSSVTFTSQSWQMLEHSQSPWAPPIYPFKTVMPVAFLLLGFQGIAEFLKAIYKIKTGEHYGS
ncbi:MAG: TRAP transporter small permease subunit [Flexistipes sinusarabici]|uniref:TRAP transporter small permease subunit n=1 Tax=Flexistipes sinusarabici TaxID=2352 RepID=A0A5D0MNL7_FLESI|nr:TRAP transporter small permease subunit [Flexistipes sinusarabici]TYB34002.1 MAG: TRAP transporter small permease subunit [Flexistipes sinusarabici]